MPRARTLLAALGVLIALAGGCLRDPEPGPGQTPSPGPSASPTETLPPVGADCRDLATQGLTLRLENSAGLEVAAVELGSGPEGVVLAHQSDASMCQWLPYATVLAQQGYRVVAFDFAGFGASSPTQSRTYLPDIRAVVDYLRSHNTPRVVVVGASMGATMSIVAAAAIIPPIDGVVAISPPRTFDGLHAERAAPQLRTPALYIAGDADGDYEVYARDLNDETPAGLGEVLIVSSPEHGVALVGAQTPAGAQVRAAIAAFLEEHLSPPATTTPPR